jgi:hypothetical protein
VIHEQHKNEWAKKTKLEVQWAVNAFAETLAHAHVNYGFEGEPRYNICVQCDSVEIFSPHGIRLFSNVNEDGKGGVAENSNMNFEDVDEEFKTNFPLKNECLKCGEYLCCKCVGTGFKCNHSY